METRLRPITRTILRTPSTPRLRWHVSENCQPGRSPTLTADNHHAENSNHRDCAAAEAHHRAPSNYRNRDRPVRWVGWRAEAPAYRAPTRRRPLSPRTVGDRPPGARVAAIAFSDGVRRRGRPGNIIFK